MYKITKLRDVFFSWYLEALALLSQHEVEMIPHKVWKLSFPIYNLNMICPRRDFQIVATKTRMSVSFLFAGQKTHVALHKMLASFCFVLSVYILWHA